jgi:hypothetical protein
MCTVQLPPGVNPTAVNKYIISYHIISYQQISKAVTRCFTPFEIKKTTPTGEQISKYGFLVREEATINMMCSFSINIRIYIIAQSEAATPQTSQETDTNITTAAFKKGTITVL